MFLRINKILGTFVQTGGFPIKLAKDGKTPLIMTEPREVTPATLSLVS